MIALLNAVKAKLNAEVSGIPPVQVGVLTADLSSVAVRLGPSPRGERYINDTGIKKVMLQVLTKSTNHQSALLWMDDIATLLDSGNGGLTVTGYEFIKCEIYTEPNFVEVTGNKEYIYTALFECELIKRG